MMQTYFIKPLNTCIMRRQNVNKYRKFLDDAGYQEVDSIEEAAFVIVWTCSFRADVRDVSLRTLRELGAEYPDKKVVIAGCMPDIYPELLQESIHDKDMFTVMPWRKDGEMIASLFPPCGSGSSSSLRDMVHVEKPVTDDIDTYRKEHPDENVMFCDQFIKVVVSEGCNAQCSYCSERLAFPPYRSHSIQDIVAECRRAALASGTYDIALMGDSIGEFGCDTGESFPELLSALCAIDKRVRITLNNFHPQFFLEYFDFLVDLIGKGRIRHINLPIQSASDKVLGLMNRKYTKDSLSRIFATLNNMNYRTFDTHIIVGFPGETEADFRETLDFLCDNKPAYVLASGYMESPGSDSANLPDKVSEQCKAERLTLASATLSAAGIIVNADGSELAADRIRRMLGAPKAL